MRLKSSAFLSHGSLVLGHCHIICSTGVLNLPFEPKVLPNQFWNICFPRVSPKRELAVFTQCSLFYF